MELLVAIRCRDSKLDACSRHEFSVSVAEVLAQAEIGLNAKVRDQTTQRLDEHEFFVAVLSSFAPNNFLSAVAGLYVVLSLASGFFHWRARVSQTELRKQIDAWWIFLPVVSLDVCAYRLPDWPCDSECADSRIGSTRINFAKTHAAS